MLVTDETGQPHRAVHAVAARRHVVAGSVVAAVGFALQAAALGLGSVLLVQALMVTSLLFALRSMRCSRAGG